MKHLLWFLPVVLLTACGTSPQPACAERCAGCCDAAGECQPGNLATACGASGTVCVVCPSGTCSSGLCLQADGTDAGVDGGAGDAGATDAGSSDAGVTDAGVTRLVVTLGGRTGEFTRAQHGLEPDGGLYVEAHFGGDPACPTQSSPTPDRTLVIAGLRALTDGGTLTSQDGARVTLLDFTGALTPAPFLRASSVVATAGAMTPGVSVSFSLEATFDGGALSGSFVAEHCASLDGP